MMRMAWKKDIINDVSLPYLQSMSGVDSSSPGAGVGVQLPEPVWRGGDGCRQAPLHVQELVPAV